ncbi:hypothetical protein B0H13DRAFT_1879336 [Mycena leptocephala]|nr:hypothetical protein B0H13DRAFT_1879336 [Mycena leptocephala]
MPTRIRTPRQQPKYQWLAASPLRTSVSTAAARPAVPSPTPILFTGFITHLEIVGADENQIIQSLLVPVKSPGFFDLDQEEEGALSTKKVWLLTLMPLAPLSNEEEATSGADDASSSQHLAPLTDSEEEMEVMFLVQDTYTENASPSNLSRIVVKRPAKRTTRAKPAIPTKRPSTPQPDSQCPIRALKRQRLTDAYKGRQRVVDKSSLPGGEIEPKSRQRVAEGPGNVSKLLTWGTTIRLASARKGPNDSPAQAV